MAAGFRDLVGRRLESRLEHVILEGLRLAGYGRLFVRDDNSFATRLGATSCAETEVAIIGAGICPGATCAVVVLQHQPIPEFISPALMTLGIEGIGYRGKREA